MVNLRAAFRLGWVIAVWSSLGQASPRVASTVADGPGAQITDAASPAADAPAQGGGCPAGAPGTILWSAPGSLEHGRPIEVAPVIWAPGPPAGYVVYVAAGSGVRALDCMARGRWQSSIVHHVPRAIDAITTGAVVADDGTVIVPAFVISTDAAAGGLLAVRPDGRPRWVWLAEENGLLEIAALAPLALDTAGRMFSGLSIVVEEVSELTTESHEDGNSSAILAFNLEGKLLTDYPLLARPMSAGPVVLPRDRTAFVTDGNAASLAGIPIPTVTASVVPTASPLPTPRATRPPGAPPEWSAHIPFAFTRPLRPPTPTARPTARPGEQPDPVLPRAESQLHLIEGGYAPGRVFDVGHNTVQGLVAAADVLIFQSFDRPPRLVGLAVDGDTPRQLWQHATRVPIADAPVVGRLDPASGMVELIYVDNDGVAVSLDVPGRPDAARPPTFNWSWSLGAPPGGAPVLGDGNLAYVTAGDTVRALDRADGHTVWSIRLPNADRPSSALALAPGGTLYVGALSGRLYAIATASRGLDPSDERGTGRVKVRQ